VKVNAKITRHDKFSLKLFVAITAINKIIGIPQKWYRDACGFHIILNLNIVHNRNLKLMKLTILHKLILAFFAVMIFITLIISCRKIDHFQDREQKDYVDPISKFFLVPANVDPKVKAIAQSIYRQNQQRNFIENLVKRIGYPHWDKAMIASKKRN
jgi:hypothetical protein